MPRHKPLVTLIQFLFLIIFSSGYSAEPHDSCKEWFINRKIKQDKNCEISCLVLETDMKTYMCPNQCEILCKADLKKAKDPTNLYGLTDDEEKVF